MSNEIHEIIRVLQLTTYDEEEWDADDLTVMKKALVRVIFASLYFCFHRLVNTVWLYAYLYEKNYM